MGATLADVAKTLCFLTDMDTFATFNEAYVAGFGNAARRAAPSVSPHCRSGAPSRSRHGPTGPRDLRAMLGAVPGAIAIVVVLLLLPVAICMGGAVLAAVLGIALNRDAEVRGEGSELLDLNV